MSRPPPPYVPAISNAGIRYEQVEDPGSLGFDEPTGYLAAINEGSGEVQWVLRVYENPIRPGIETDVQEVYFTSMELMGSELRITNESGERYAVDVNTRRVTLLR